MNNLELQKLRDLPIEGVAERLGLRVERHKALCPFHDDHHASLSFSTHKNTCRCFVCMDRSLGTIDLVMRSLRLDFKGACRWLADSHSVILDAWKPVCPSKGDERGTFDAARYEPFFLRPRLTDEARRFLFQERRLDPRVISWCRLSSWRDRHGVDWLQIPYYDTEGRLVGVQNRRLEPLGAFPGGGTESHPTSTERHSAAGASPPRFRFPYGSRCNLYNLPVLKWLQPDDELWITEGCSDCWAMLSTGRKAIAVPSATLLKSSDVETITRSLSNGWRGTFHMFPDRDAPGESLFLQLRQHIPGIVHHQLPPGCKDFSDYYQHFMAERQP